MASSGLKLLLAESIIASHAATIKGFYHKKFWHLFLQYLTKIHDNKLSPKDIFCNRVSYLGLYLKNVNQKKKYDFQEILAFFLTFWENPFIVAELSFFCCLLEYFSACATLNSFIFDK
ncbi:hypothetical protein BpHYR1_010505 [Brachionus plicatilis]|uniref:Uncharacterized protein n=1 Tax=Brachionus plicatilis TaxID=10195 RepID=A0A3M7SI58_BRAPC|nr:hypothetical protein BpHYR1_010505 [Brachionus plicatilis]